MRILVLGGSGLVGSRFTELSQSDFEVKAPTHEKLDLLDFQKLEDYLNKDSSEVVINFAAYTNVDSAEEEKDDKSGLVYKLNAEYPKQLVRICVDLNKYLIHISTDYVFDGRKESAPYKEEDETRAVNWYGLTKLFGEQFVLERNSSVLVIRPEMPYSAVYTRKNDFARFFYSNLKEGKEIEALTDQKITPVFVDELVEALKKVLEKMPRGVLHMASSDYTTPFEYAAMMAEQIGADKNLIQPVKFEEFNIDRKASRPKNSWLDVTKFEREFGKGILKTNEESIREFLGELI